jgi:geranylgeranyl diphosphate synthase type II
MVRGQVVDIASEGQAVSRDTLSYIHHHKTGALLRASVRLGAILGGATPEQRAQLDAYAAHVGLGFQIADDILDVTKTAAELGKTPGKDAAVGKATYPSVYGLAAAREQLDAEVAAALEALAGWGEPAEPLRAIARFVAAEVA